MNPDFTQYLDQASKIHTVFAVPLWAGVIKKQLEKLCGFEICLTSHLLSYIVFLVSVAATHTGCACPLWRGTHCTAANDPEKWFYQHFFHFCMIWSVFFIYLLPYKWFCQWKCGHNVVYLKNLPCFFELKFWAEPGQAVTPQHGDTRQGHTPATTINGDYVAK